MKALLDTNIVIHRETNRIVNHEIGQLFNWLDRLKYEKCIHSLTKDELLRHKDEMVVHNMTIKLESYTVLKTEAELHPDIKTIIEQQDITANDINDSKLLNELINNRVDCLITEDKEIIKKAGLLGLEDRVYNIDNFLKSVISENPELVDYKVLSIKKEYFGNINLQDIFFDTFREDYEGFDRWFNKKAENIAYVCRYKEKLGAFLYLKIEGKDENYSDIFPKFPPKKRLKIGTLKVTFFGLHLGERLLKIAFDNALKQKVDEIYITIFEKNTSNKLLIQLLEDFGFILWGKKMTPTGEELVYSRDFRGLADRNNPRKTFPFISQKSKVWFVSIYPEYHTELFPDSILKTESPDDFVENQPHRNAISKVYISHSFERNINIGDIIVFYRTGGYYKGVVTTIAVVESVSDNLKNEQELIKKCRGRTVLTIDEIKKFWTQYPKLKPFVVDLLYTYSFPKRINLEQLINIGVISGVDKMPRGFAEINYIDLINILRETESNENIISNQA